MNDFIDIKGYEGIYKINADGKIISILQNNGKSGRKMGNEIKSTIGRGGYISIALRNNGKNYRHFLHRLIAIAFIPNPENKPCINHINSKRHDNRIENLEWCTYSENNSHAHKFGGQKQYVGESHSHSILTSIKVAEIRAKYKKHLYTMPMLASEYNISKGAIQAIINKKTWKL